MVLLRPATKALEVGQLGCLKVSYLGVENVQAANDEHDCDCNLAFEVQLEAPYLREAINLGISSNSF